MQNMCTILKKVPGPLGQLLGKKKGCHILLKYVRHFCYFCIKLLCSTEKQQLIIHNTFSGAT